MHPIDGLQIFKKRRNILFTGLTLVSAEMIDEFSIQRNPEFGFFTARSLSDKNDFIEKEKERKKKKTSQNFDSCQLFADDFFGSNT